MYLGFSFNSYREKLDAEFQGVIAIESVSVQREKPRDTIG